MISRAGQAMKGVGLAADSMQLLTTTAEFVHAFSTIRSQPGLSDADRDKALIKLISTGLLTGALLTISIRGGIKDMAGGTLKMSGVDESGRIVVGGEESAVPHGKTGAPELAPPRTVPSRLDGEPGMLPEGWSRPKTGPVENASLPEGRVEVRIARDPTGRIIGAETHFHPGADPHSIAIHEDIAKLLRTEGEALQALVHQQRQAFGGEPPPLELQLELKKLFDELAAAEKKLAGGTLGEAAARDLQDRLKLLQHEIGNAQKAIADPSLRSAYPPDVVGLPVKPTTLPKKGPAGDIVTPAGYPNPPDGHMYYLKDDGTFGLRPKTGHTGAGKFGLEEIDGKFVATNRTQVGSLASGRELTPELKAKLKSLGYIVQENGVIRRPSGHSEAGQPRMVPLEVDATGRVQIVEGTESLAEVQARITDSLPTAQKTELDKIRADATLVGQKVVLVEGLYDTGVTWSQVLTKAKQAKLTGILLKHGTPQAEIDRLINGLTGKTGTLKVVMGTTPVRGAGPYRDLFTAAHGAPGTGAEVHHGDPLYLGGGHDPTLLFGLPPGPHDEVHAFFDGLTLPKNSALGAVPLQSTVIQNKVKPLAKPAAAIVDPVTGDVRYDPLTGKPP